MACLPHFNGWTDTSNDKEQVIKDLVKMLPMRRLDETKEYVEEPRFRNIINNSFHRAIRNNKKQMASGADEYQHSDQPTDRRAQSGLTTSQRRKLAANRGNRPPRHAQSHATKVNTRPPRNASGKKNNGNRQRRHQNNGYGGMNMNNSMMPPGMNMHNSMHQHQMYQYDPYNQANQSAHYMPPHPENDYYYGQANTSWMPMPHPHGAEYDNPNFSYLDQSMVSTDMHYYGSNGHGAVHDGNWSGVPVQDASVSMCGEDMSQCSDQASQMCVPEGVSLSFIGPKIGSNIDNCKTPSKVRNVSIQHGAPPSPYWGHLNMATLAMSGLASPGARHPASPQHFVYEQNENVHHGQVYGNGQVKPPLINNYNAQGYQGMPNMVPPSPATQFMMSSQANNRQHAYFGPSNPGHFHHHASPMKHKAPKFAAEENIAGAQSDESSSATTEDSSTGDATRNSSREPNDESEAVPVAVEE